jgi:hypothetical protein
MARLAPVVAFVLALWAIPRLIPGDWLDGLPRLAWSLIMP